MKHAALLCIITLALSASGAGFADTTAPAHYQKHCIDCHSRITGGDGSVLYKRKDSMVRTFADLNQRIAFYIKELELEWDEEQILKIADYLNRSYYQLQQD